VIEAFLAGLEGARAAGAVDHRQDADRDDHHGEHRFLLDGPDHDLLEDDAAREGDRQRGEEGRPVGQAPDGQLVGDVRRPHRHLALREIDHLGGAVDQDEREREAGEDASLRDAAHRQLGELARGQRADRQEDAAGHEQPQHRDRGAGADPPRADVLDPQPAEELVDGHQ